MQWRRHQTINLELNWSRDNSHRQTNTFPVPCLFDRILNCAPSHSSSQSSQFLSPLPSLPPLPSERVLDPGALWTEYARSAAPGLQISKTSIIWPYDLTVLTMKNNTPIALTENQYLYNVITMTSLQCGTVQIMTRLGPSGHPLTVLCS